MKPSFTLSLAMAALLFAGCGREQSAEHIQEQPAATGATFSAKRGLEVPEATAKFIGLQTADVEERKVNSAMPFPARMLSASTALALLNTGDATQLRVGNSTKVELKGGSFLNGSVASIDFDAAKASGFVEVQIQISDERHELAAGDFVTASVVLGKRDAVVSVPRSAMLRTAEGWFVYTVSGEHFVRAPVKVGATNNDFVEITDGLYAGDKVVVQPVTTLWLAELQSIRGGKACADGH